jgi:Flp pilus assembly protein TadD
MQTFAAQSPAELTDCMDRKKPTPIIRDSQTLYARGIDAIERNHFEEAAAMLRQAAQLTPDSAAIQLALGIALTRILDVPGAQGALETAIGLEPGNFYPRFRLGELFMRIGVIGRAQEELQHALDISVNESQRRMVRELLALEAKRAPKRIWRPDFSRLISGRRKRQ